MTSSTGKVKGTPDFQPEYDPREIYSKVVDYLFRHYSIATEKGVLEDDLSEQNLNKISNYFTISKFETEEIVNKCIKSGQKFTEFFRNIKLKWPHEKKPFLRKERIYLHKIHRIAPVFDYKRAVHNLEALYNLNKKIRYWPTFSTQLAIVIYITDHLASSKKDKLIQKNVRALTTSSAYAFHRAKNMYKIKL